MVFSRLENENFQYGKCPILEIKYLTYSISFILNIPLKRHKINYLKSKGNKGLPNNNTPLSECCRLVAPPLGAGGVKANSLCYV